MDLNNIANIVSITNGTISLLGQLPKYIDKIRNFIVNDRFELKADDMVIDHLEEYLNYKKSKEEIKRCKVILKKHNLPKKVGIMCKSENDICFMPNNMIVNKYLNNLYLKSNDGTAELAIGGGFFSFNMKTNESGFIHQKIMNGTIINYKGDFYLLRHPLGGYPNYFARLDLFINGIIIEFDDGSKVGVYYQ